MSVPFADALKSAPWLRSKASRRLLTALSAEDHPVRFVGGCVRDGLLGDLTPKGDLDLATPARPDQIIALLEKAGIKVIPTGLAHGTVTAVCSGQTFEITTLREDIACDGRHAEVRFTDDFAADAARRDFTINAMSVDCQGQLFDYFGGREDLADGRVRFVGDAQQRVREDYLRILRFFRFFASYGRPPTDQQALEACRHGAHGIKTLSGERIRVEMLKLLSAKDPDPALDLMIETGVAVEILPVSPKLDLLRRLSSFAPDADPLLRLAALLRSAASEARTVETLSDRWRLSNAERERLSRLVLEPSVRVSFTPRRARRDLYRLGSALYLDLFHLSAAATDFKAEDLENAKAIVASWRSPVLPIRGQDLIDRQMRPGPDLGKLLSELEAWWLDQDMQPDREACLSELERRLGTDDPSSAAC
ncbi:MAG: CCA tRNA nucleotidyltransferase [Geminicoccaceae bacterium]